MEVAELLEAVAMQNEAQREVRCALEGSPDDAELRGLSDELAETVAELSSQAALVASGRLCRFRASDGRLHVGRVRGLAAEEDVEAGKSAARDRGAALPQGQQRDGP